jgi:DNA-binding XRE family transcriptional regulator
MLQNTVKKWRLERHLTKADLARRIGVCRSYITKLEVGSLQPSGEVMFRIAEYFKIRVEDVFQRERAPKAGSHFFGTKTLPKDNARSICPQTISSSSASAAGRS